jgi:two-component system chemotaxis response regulator CheB
MAAAAFASSAPGPAPHSPKVIGIGASTGGPNALVHLLGALPRPFPLPILVAQHLADGFHGGLAQWLAMGTGHAVKLAEDGEPLRAGVVYVAPQDRHLAAAGGRVRLSGGEPVDGFCPSATVLFRSLAQEYGAGAAGIVLTGMGRDGAAGLLELRTAGGFTAAQGPGTAAVFAMPDLALRSGAAAVSLELDELARTLVRLARPGEGGHPSS